MSEVAAEGLFLTANGAKYLQQLCKHFAHKLQVTCADANGSIVFPRDARGADWPADARVDLSATAEGLHCRIAASAPGQLEGLQGAVTRHLNQFAFREAPLVVEWRPSPAPDHPAAGPPGGTL